MTVYHIEIKQSAKKELAQLPKTIAKKIALQIMKLADNPRPNGCKKLVGTEQPNETIMFYFYPDLE